MLELLPPFYFLTFAKVSVSVLKKFGLKKVSVSVSKTFGLEKSLGIGLENIWSRKKVLVSVSKIFGLEKKSRSRKFWSRKKVSVSVLMKYFGLVTQRCPPPVPPYPDHLDRFFPGQWHPCPPRRRWYTTPSSYRLNNWWMESQGLVLRHIGIYLY